MATMIEADTPRDAADDSARAGLRERNWAAFDEHYPELSHWLRAQPPLASRIVAEPDGRRNIDIGHTRLYEPDAESFTRRQLQSYFDKPQAFTINTPPYPAAHQAHFVNCQHFTKVLDWLKERDIVFDNRVPEDNYGTVIIFGIGLGLHIEPLLDTLTFRNMALLEQSAEFMLHSMDCVDWRRIIDAIIARKGRLSFFINERPEILSHSLYWSLRETGFSLIDGSFIYRHYESYVLDEAYRDFNERMPTLCHSAGYIEDEEVMIRNTGANLASYDGLLLAPRPRMRKETPVFIIGSGPSIDGAIDTIKRWRDQIILVTGGTSLRIMLANGIRPDFHCELENVPVTYDHTARLAEQYGLDGITLIASTTVDPRVPACFENRIFYFREVLSSTHLFAEPGEEVIGTAPTCTNLAVRAMIELGFHQMYFFGLDYGARDSQYHHSKETVYLAIKGYPYGQEPMHIPLDGNFGGTIYTNSTLIWSKQMMSTLLVAHGSITVHNCSDGARIMATSPLLPESIALSGGPALKARDIAAVGRELRPLSAGELIKRAPLADILRFYDDTLAAMIETVRSSHEAGEDFITMHDRLMPMVPRQSDGQAAAVTRTLIDGSLTLIMQFAHFVIRRLDPPRRAIFLDAFMTDLAVSLERMRDVGGGMLRSALEYHAGAQEG